MGNRIKLNGTTANAFQIGLKGPILSSNNVTSEYQLNLPANVGNNNQYLRTDGTGNLSWATVSGGGGTPGGANTQVQFNDDGSFGGDANFTFNKTTSLLSVTGNIGVSNGITTTDFVTFNTAQTGNGAIGQLTWNDGDGTLDLTLKGGNTTLNIGTQEYARVYNAEATTLNKGEVVYIFGAQGNRVSVKRAQANTEATSFGTLGLVAETIASGAEGYIIVSGALYKLNTDGLTAGQAVYLSPTVAGGYTTTKPVAPNQLVILGWIERVSTTVGSIYVKVDNGYELDELHDVLITSPQAGQVLVYNASNLWVNGNAQYSNTAGTVTANAQPNITSVGNLTSIVVTGNANVSNLNLTGNIVDTGALAIQTGNNGNINLQPNGTGIVVANSAISATGNITAPFFIGNGALLTGISGGGGGSSIANGTSNINIPIANGNILFSANAANSMNITPSNIIVGNGTGGTITGALSVTSNVINATTITVTNMGVNLLSVTGNANISNLNISAIANIPNIQIIRIGGGNSGEMIATLGDGNLYYTTVAPISRSLANGNSSISIPSSGSNIIFNVTGAPNTAVFTNSSVQFATGAGGNITGANVINANTFNTGNILKLGVYTVANKPASGNVGQIISISDSTPGGKIAFWDTTSNRWSYVNDNSAV